MKPPFLPRLTLLGTLAFAGGAPAAAATWTVLVYGHADHNLTPSLILDMQEMEGAGSATGFDLIVQADFNPNARTTGLPASLVSGLTRFRIGRDQDPQTITSEVVQRLPESDNMDDPQVLSDFLAWGVAAYPAERYGLVFWNHGGQWVGFGGDWQDAGQPPQPSSILTTGEIAQALDSVKARLPGGKWEFIGFDTCLMGGAEVLADFVRHTDVFLACPEIDYGDGWDYEGAFAYLKSNPAVAALDFGRQEVEIWQAHHFQPRNASDLALAAHAAYDLRQFGDVQAKLFAFGGLLADAAREDPQTVGRLRLASTPYMISSPNEAGRHTDFVDLGEFAASVGQDGTFTPALREAATALVASIDQLVVAKALGREKQRTRGLSVYYPVGGLQHAPAYENLALSQAPGSTWTTFLKQVAVGSGNDQVPPGTIPGPLPGGTDLVLFNTPVPPGAPAVHPRHLDLRVTSEDAAHLYARVVNNQVLADPSAFVYVGEVISGRLPGAGNYRVQWNGALPVLYGADPDGGFYLGSLYDPAGTGLMYSLAEYVIPDFVFGWYESYLVLLVSVVGADGEGQVVAVLDAESDLVAPDALEVWPGDFIQPLFLVEWRWASDPSLWVLDILPSEFYIEVPFEGIEGLRVRHEAVPEATYGVELLVTDLYENESGIAAYTVQVGPTGPGGPIVILQPPESQTVAAGASVTFSVVATGGVGPLSYRWYKDGVDLEVTGATLSLPTVSSAAAGSYVVVVSDNLSAVPSSPAVLTVAGPPPALRLSARLAAGGACELRIQGATLDDRLRVEASENLRDWTSLVTLTQTGNSDLTYLDPGGVGLASRFYRVARVTD